MNKRKGKMGVVFALAAVICATVMADTINFTFNNIVGDGNIVPGDGVIFSTITDSNPPSPIMGSRSQGGASGIRRH